MAHEPGPIAYQTVSTRLEREESESVPGERAWSARVEVRLRRLVSWFEIGVELEAGSQARNRKKACTKIFHTPTLFPGSLWNIIWYVSLIVLVMWVASLFCRVDNCFLG